MVMLGDNLVAGSLADVVTDFESCSVGCRVFLKELPNVDGLGVALMDGGRLARVVEKPTRFISNLAVTGIYLFDNRCFDMIDQLYPSGRNELEVTDLINAYVALQACDTHVLEGDWLDAGTFESLEKAARIFDPD
jgi:glucose-1-phosphate thymidylyltransferase